MMDTKVTLTMEEIKRPLLTNLEGGRAAQHPEVPREGRFPGVEQGEAERL